MTFNYSKLATLVPKQLLEASSGNESRQDGGYPPQDQLSTSGYPPAMLSDAASRQTNKIANHQNQDAASRRKGDRHSKEKQLLAVRLSQSIVKQIKGFCIERGLSIQDFIELSASHYIEHVASHQKDILASHHVASQLAAMAASKLAHDDLMMFKTHDDIIMLFRQITGRKWTAADDRAASPFNNVDRRLIEIGMIHTVFNARGKRINSFAYFIPEIQLMIDLHVNNENLDIYLRARRERFSKWLQNQGKNPNAPKP